MNLNEEDIFKIATSKTKYYSLNIVISKISHTYDSVSDNWRNEILFDCILDLIYYCLNKGFSLAECVKCCSIQYDLINQFDKNDAVANKFANMSSTLELFKMELINLNKIMNDKKLKDFIDYVNLTFITQFNLYKYVFTHERENQIQNQEKLIYSPPTALVDANLSQSKHISLYDYESKLADIENREKRLNDYFKIERDALARQEAELRNYLKYDNTNSQSVDEEFVKKLIDNISVPVNNLASKMLRLEFEEYKKREELTLERKKLVKPEDIALTLKPTSGVKDTKKSTKKK